MRPEANFGARTVYELMPGITVGSQIQEGASIMLTALNNNQFTVEASFPQVQDFIEEGDLVELTVGAQRINGQATRVIARDGRIVVTISVQSGALRGGEIAMISVFGSITNHPNVIPVSALREDTFGYFIFYVESREGRLGSNYYVRRQQVTAGRNDALNIAISTVFGMDMPDGPIITNSDMLIQPGDRVRLVAGQDFTPLR